MTAGVHFPAIFTVILEDETNERTKEQKKEIAKNKQVDMDEAADERWW